MMKGQLKAPVTLRSRAEWPKDLLKSMRNWAKWSSEHC
ncbi:hypothetical protein ANCCAN_19636 [Ancylostoma caninum]|uniref:Uncharacterized protein n=1 Tax=Ancylostoma caninum TaxID=29170 RepID=A0A368FQS1_ANCCA|nr:hypothetical protein ANCCAN_19636 [Ancylostoma caninum]